MRNLIVLGSLAAVALTYGTWLTTAQDQPSKETESKVIPRKANEKLDEQKLSGTYKNKEQKTTGDKSPAVTNQFTADEEAIRKTAETFQAAYNKGDAKAAASHFSADAEYVDEEGNLFSGQKEIEEDFQNFFAENKGATIEITIESLRVLNANLAVEDGTTVVRDSDGDVISHSHYMAVHTNQAGHWLAAIVRDQAPTILRSHNEEVSQLSWMEGQWVDESDESVVTFNAKMTDDDHFLLRDFRVTVDGQDILHGSQRIGWDPMSGRLRAWTFDSQGGHFDGYWHRDSDSWILNSTGVTGAGESASGTSIFTLVNPHTMNWQAVNQELDGIRLPDSEIYTLVRRGPAPEIQEEKPVEASTKPSEQQKP